MANTIPLLLNRGIDLVTPPLLSEAGTLLDAHNYEMSADIGYRRWDGYERRDGYPTGHIARFARVFIDEAGVSDFTQIQAGDLVYHTKLGDTQSKLIGMVLAKPSGGTNNGFIDYIPFDSNYVIHISDNMFIKRPALPTFNPYTAGSTSVDGRTAITDPETYLTTIRNYSTILRNLVQPATSYIAGVFYSRDRSYEVLNTRRIQVALVPQFLTGELIRYQGFLYIFGGYTAPASDVFAHLIPLGTASAPTNNNLVGVNTGTTQPAIADYGYVTSERGYLVYLKSPTFTGGNTGRERVLVTPSLYYNFTLGTYAASANGPSTGTYFATVAGGATLVATGTVNQITQDSGGWVGGTAVGHADFTPANPLTRRHLVAGDEIHTQFPVTGSSRIMTVGAGIEITLLAGTRSLLDNNTRYQWGTYNFYASSNTRQLFGANGVYPAFMATPEYVTNVRTQTNLNLDNPKYLTFHAGVQLGLGFSDGSFQVSVGGVPYDFSGVRGALEIGTGDDITGILESANDSSIIFGKRSIRRVTGTTDTTLALETVTPNAGAFDYSCVNVGSTPVFTGPTGVSTLEQVAVYGDFIGERATSAVSTWLIPKLVPAEGGLELAGVACALPVRGKSQYRLFLNSGNVVNVTFTTEGPKVLKGNYKQPLQKPLVPLAWSSAVSDTGREHVEVVWNVDLAQRTGKEDFEETSPNPMMGYRLDNGWGFDGTTFEHWFDVAYTFVNNGAVATRVEKARMYGMNYGVATLDLKASSIEKDFKQPFSTKTQSINMPYHTQLLSDNMEPVTGIVDHQNWGFGVKLRINGTKAPALTTTEPSHICQVLVLHLDEEGANDN